MSARNDRHSPCAEAGTAGLLTLGALTAEDARAFERHVAEPCELCRAELESARTVVAELDGEQLATGAIALHAPPPHLRDWLLRRIEEVEAPDADPLPVQTWKDWKPEQATPTLAAGIANRRANDGEFEPTGVAGITARRLSVDAANQTVTMLVRMAPGSAYPGHRHASAEQCFVLEGDLEVEGEQLGAGDYQHAEAGSVHGVQTTKGGCLLFLVSSTGDELIA